MSKIITDSKYYTDIANTIREKTHSDESYKPEEMSTGVEKVYEAGKHSLFENMTLINYMFYREHNKNNYEIFLNSDLSNVTHAQYLFQENNWIVEFALPITLKPNLIHYLFQGCKTIKKVSGLDRLQVNVVSGVFQDCIALEDAGTIDFAKVSYAGKTFQNCLALKEIRIAGTIGLSVDFQYSPLSKASIESIMAALSDTKTGMTITFKKTAVDVAFETSAGLMDGSSSALWLKLTQEDHSNWSFSLV